MSLIPKILHQTAQTKKLTWEEGRLTARLRRMHPGWDYHLWDDEDNSRIVGEYFPDYAERYQDIRFGVAKADIARYVYMHAFGGFYVDTDYKVFKAFDDELLALRCVIPLEGARPQERLPYLQYLGIGNAVFGSQAGHPFWERLITHIFEVNRPENMRDRNDILPMTGPRAVTNFFMDHLDEFADISIPEKNQFYPSIRWMAMKSSAGPETYGVHLHWGSWRHRSLNVAVRILARRKLNALVG